MATRRAPAEVHSLWLVPTGAARRRLARVIARLARRCGTLPFAPHVTLLSGITLPRWRAIDQTAAVARSLRPFRVRLAGAGHEAVFFRCLYLRADGAGLRRARACALRAFQENEGRRRGGAREVAGRAGGRFRPHLSLVYARLPSAERRRLAMQCGKQGPLDFMARGIALVRTSGAVPAWRIVGVRRFRS